MFSDIIQNIIGKEVSHYPYYLREDTQQQAYLIVLKLCKDFEFRSDNDGQAISYVQKTLHYELQRYLYKNKGFSKLFVDEEPDPFSGEAYENVEEKEDLYRALNNLNEYEKEIVKLYFWEEKNECEIAKAIGCSQQNVSYILRNILNKLKKMLME